eukprot:gene17016-19644_t
MKQRRTSPGLRRCDARQPCGPHDPGAAAVRARALPLAITKPSMQMHGNFPLTVKLYEKGQDAFKDVTCIPNGEFQGYAGNVTLISLKKLRSVGAYAFLYYENTLTIRGSFPSLAYLNAYAFQGAGSSAGDSSITLVDLPALVGVAEHTFRFFRGELVFKGPFPMLTFIGTYAFMTAGSGASKPGEIAIESYTPRLTSVGSYAFKNFGLGSNKWTLRFTGAFPALREVGEFAFENVGAGGKTNGDVKPNALAIRCHSSAGLTIMTDAFKRFNP